MYTSYTANIVSLLQATTKSIRTLEDLYKSKLEYGVHDTPYNRWYFANAVGKLRQDFYNNKIVTPPNKPEKFVNYTHGVAQLRKVNTFFENEKTRKNVSYICYVKGFYALHIEQAAAYKEVEKTFYEHEKCGLVTIDFHGNSFPWMVIEKRSRFKEIIKVKYNKRFLNTFFKFTY